MEKVTIDFKRLCLELEKQGKTKADLSRDMAKNKNFVGLMEKNPDQPAEVERLQDLLHGLEFAADENEKRRAGTKLQQSRRTRRQEKDEVKRLELIVKFFDEPNPKNTLNKMRQLLGKQRKEEEYLNGERHYNNRIEE